MSNWVERVQQLEEHERISKQDEEHRKSLAVAEVLDALQIENKLIEIKDQLCGVGQIERSGGTVDLISSWPTYNPPHTHEENISPGYGIHDSKTVDDPASVDLTRMCLEVHAWASAASSLSNLSNDWDGKSIIVNVDILKHVNSKLKNVIGIGRLTINSQNPILGRLDEMDNLLVRACQHFQTKIWAKADRQEIIKRVLSGELMQSALPVDFGYKFPSNHK